MDDKAKESSVQFMLAEFDRIQSAESFNRGTGEARVSLFVTIVSLTVAALVGLWQLVNTNDITSLREYFLVAFVGCAFVSLIGYITYRLLIQRWILSIIYLRKLARIRRWFAEQDLQLLDALVYSTDETKPPFTSESFFSSSLFVLVSVLNSVFVVMTAICLVMSVVGAILLTNQLVQIVLVVAGVIGGAVLWRTQSRIAEARLSALEGDEFAAFPARQDV